ncbi:hypothetical protein U9M48_034186 [Paspalum notatum var. saurae]|uniref:Retrotransposon gag domain-containing protein n=1 Tax=Paspalum notatum var. saurae TaxID=547442 RepID=A0AAQ3U988_PASNO
MTLELKPSNFTKWSTAFRATCGKFGLLHHLATASTSNSDEAWLQADFCVRGWMYSTVSDAVLNLAMTDDKQTASALWAAIGAVFRANKAPRAIFLNHEFHSMTQGDLSIDAYCVRMKEKADELRDVGQPVYEPNLVLNLLRGLNEVYSNVADNIAGMQPLTFAAARHQLLLKELRPQNEEKVRATTALPAAASSHGGHQQQQLRGGRRPNTKQLASSPSHTPPAATNVFPGLQSPDRRTCGTWRARHPSWTTPPGGSAPTEVPAPRRAQPGHTRASPAANTAFAPLRTSSGGSNTRDATGLIAALRDMQQRGDRIVDSGASTHMTSSAGMLTQRLPPPSPQ